MTDLQPRPELWRRPATRVAAAGGANFRIPDSVLAPLKAANVELIQRPLREPDGSVAKEVAEADVLISGGALVDEAAVSQLRNVRFLLRPYVGYDDIDVDAATRHGIVFANVPDAFIEEVANHTLALILAGNRKLLETDRFVKSGKWSAGGRNREASVPIRRLSALTLGLVGFGNIGKLVVDRARPFGFRFLAADPFVTQDAAAAYGVGLVPMDQLLAESDVISLHVFLNAETRGMINARCFSLMKPDAYLVNTSRGPVVDEKALIEALQTGKIAGAGLDVFEVEPVAADNPLLQMPNVTLTSHIASYSVEGDISHQARTSEILMQVVRGELPERKVVVNKDLYDQLASSLNVAHV
ncbi:MAG: C-terminal binding protein [Chloroflexota bacterium]|nr:C-terminal binding protein [Chloroflexota bacterium]